MLLKPVNPESFPLFANAKPTKPVLPGRKRLNYLRLRKVPDHSASYFFCRYRALGLCRTTALHIHKNHKLSAGGREVVVVGGGRSRWKMDDKYQDKWRLSQTVLSLTKAERAPDISPRPKLSILITKFTCQRGRKSTREWGRRFVKSGQKNLIKYKNADLGR